MTLLKKSISLDKQTRISYSLVAKRTREIEKSHNSVNFQNLLYHVKGPTNDADFNNFIDAGTLFDDIASKKDLKF